VPGIAYYLQAERDGGAVQERGSLAHQDHGAIRGNVPIEPDEMVASNGQVGNGSIADGHVITWRYAKQVFRGVQGSFAARLERTGQVRPFFEARKKGQPGPKEHRHASFGGEDTPTSLPASPAMVCF
jgi:hypothetical protein